MQQSDVIVIGAGMVGVSAAQHLQARGRDVALIDRRDPGEETSYGNAGVIGFGPYVPIAMPRNLLTILQLTLNRVPSFRWNPAVLFAVAPWLAAFYAHSSEGALERIARVSHALFGRALVEHKALMASAHADRFLRETGLLVVHRREQRLANSALERRLSEKLGATYRLLDRAETLAVEPHLKPVFTRAVLWDAYASVSSPGGVTKAYARLFVERGGAVYKTEVLGLKWVGQGWLARTDAGPFAAREVVVAAGPWSNDLLLPLGYRFPLAAKRGYHQHFVALRDASLARPVVDAENGFVITPMEQGIRLTTGIELDRRDAPGRGGADRARNFSGSRVVSSWAAGRVDALARPAAVVSRFAPRRWSRATSRALVARFRSRPSGLHAGTGDRASARRVDDRRASVRRSRALFARALLLSGRVVAAQSIDSKNDTGIMTSS